MTFKTTFYGIPADVRANTVIPLLVGPPGANATVDDGSITNAKLANVATATFKGRTTAGTGVPQDLTATQATALLNLADGSLKGLMSSADFTKLAGVASGATANTGTVTTVSVVTANGVSGSVTNAGTTPAITITLGAITPSSIALTGNISSAAWTTSGLRLRGVAATLTDTTSSGTVAAATTDVLGGNTIAASSATTFTDYSTLTLNLPTAGTNVTLTNRWALRLGGGMLSSGQSLTGSQAQSLVDLSTTWNTTGTPTALKVNVTDTASNASSLLMQLQIGSGDRLTLTKNSVMTFINSVNSGIVIDPANAAAVIRSHNGNTLSLGSSSGTSSGNISNLWLKSAGTVDWNGDTILVRDASNTLAQRNGTNAQLFRVYRSFTDASNYSRISVSFSSTTAIIATEGLGTGSRGNIAFGSAALATTATVGYVMIPSCAGVPTGVPADIPTGQVAMHYDSTNNRIYVYSGDTWRQSSVLT